VADIDVAIKKLKKETELMIQKEEIKRYSEDEAIRMYIDLREKEN
jgi:hypothetical protein